MFFHHECKLFLAVEFKNYKMFIFVLRAQTVMKSRLKGAQTGHNLLKKKADALAIRFRSILKKIIEV